MPAYIVALDSTLRTVRCDECDEWHLDDLSPDDAENERLFHNMWMRHPVGPSLWWNWRRPPDE
jgi:hypothetical protein